MLVFSFVGDFIPYVNNPKSAYEAAYGLDPIIQQKLADWERVVSGVSLTAGPVSKAVKSGGKAVVGVTKWEIEKLKVPRTKVDKPVAADKISESSKLGKPLEEPPETMMVETKGARNVPEGYYQDANGRWHRPDGGYATAV